MKRPKKQQMNFKCFQRAINIRTEDQRVSEAASCEIFV